MKLKKFNENFDDWDDGLPSKQDVYNKFKDIIDPHDELRVEDGGCAVIVLTDFYSQGEDNGVNLTFTSWDEELKHPWFEEQYKRFKIKIS